MFNFLLYLIKKKFASRSVVLVVFVHRCGGWWFWPCSVLISYRRKHFLLPSAPGPQNRETARANPKQPLVLMCVGVCVCVLVDKNGAPKAHGMCTRKEHLIYRFLAAGCAIQVAYTGISYVQPTTSQEGRGGGCMNGWLDGWLYDRMLEFHSHLQLDDYNFPP